MIKSVVKKYFSIVFLFATLVGVFHHHNDLKQHTDCQICMVQSSIADADTPVENIYLSKISLVSETIITKLSNLYIYKRVQTLHARAPPKLS